MGGGRTGGKIQGAKKYTPKLRLKKKKKTPPCTLVVDVRVGKTFTNLIPKSLGKLSGQSISIKNRRGTGGLERGGWKSQNM